MGNSLSYQATNNNQSGIQSQQSLNGTNHQNNNNEVITNGNISNISKETLSETIDTIAVNFMLKQNLIDLIRFSDKSYYDNMLILTSSILKKELTDLEIGMLQDRVKNSANKEIQLNSSFQKNKTSPNTRNDGFQSNSKNDRNVFDDSNIYITNSNEIKRITIRNEKTKQKALLLISKFYIKIVTIYSAIVAVIDPQYVYDTEDGKQQFFHLKDFNSYKMIEKGTENIRIHQLFNPMGLIKKRLNILKKNLNNNDIGSTNIVVINPGAIFCKNTPENNNIPHSEIGLKELDALYFDVYDNDTKRWSKKSEAMKKKYNRDLTRFYQISTGRKVKPTSITSFAEIETIQLDKLQRCRSSSFFKDIQISTEDPLYKNYMHKINQIEQIAVLYKKRLMYILRTLFVVQESDDDENKIIINPELNMEKVSKLQEQTKDCILNMYTKCEQHFIEALLIMENIYELKGEPIHNAEFEHESSNNMAQTIYDGNNNVITDINESNTQPEYNFSNNNVNVPPAINNYNIEQQNHSIMNERPTYNNDNENKLVQTTKNKVPNINYSFPTDIKLANESPKTNSVNQTEHHKNKNTFNVPSISTTNENQNQNQNQTYNSIPQPQNDQSQPMITTKTLNMNKQNMESNASINTSNGSNNNNNIQNTSTNDLNGSNNHIQNIDKNVNETKNEEQTSLTSSITGLFKKTFFGSPETSNDKQTVNKQQTETQDNSEQNTKYIEENNEKKENIPFQIQEQFKSPNNTSNMLTNTMNYSLQPQIPKNTYNLSDISQATNNNNKLSFPNMNGKNNIQNGMNSNKDETRTMNINSISTENNSLNSLQKNENKNNDYNINSNQNNLDNRRNNNEITNKDKMKKIKNINQNNVFRIQDGGQELEKLKNEIMNILS